MERLPSLPQSAGSDLPNVHKPSLAVTLLLTVVSTGLWLAVLQTCFPVAVQRLTCEDFGLAVPFPAAAVLSLSLWEWFSFYWWVVAVAFLPAAGAFACVTVLVRHGSRSRVVHWAWGLFLILPPFFLVELLWLTIWQCTVVVNHAIALNGVNP